MNDDVDLDALNDLIKSFTQLIETEIKQFKRTGDDRVLLCIIKNLDNMSIEVINLTLNDIF